MNAKTLKALKASIAHWKRLADGKQRTGEGIGDKYCALCALYLAGDCKGCPIMALTKQTFCDDTPYAYVLKMRNEVGIGSDEFKEAARIEYNFLRALLPERQR